MNYKEFFKRYHQFENNNLPTPFWDEDRRTLEYVFHRELVPWYLKDENEDDDYKYSVSTNLTDSLGDLTLSDFYYSFECNSEVTHEHSFDDVVKCLYNYPETFKINKDDEQWFSKQELSYLRRVQKHLLFLGLKDNKEEDNTRYINEKQKNYEGVYFYKRANEEINEYISGEINFDVTYGVNTDYYKDYEEYKDKRALLLDEEDNVRLFIEYTHREKKAYKDIKDLYKIDDINDEDIIIVNYFKVLEVYDK